MPVTSESLYNEIKQYCVEHADAEMVKKYSRYFKDGYDAWGLTQQLMNEKKQELQKRKILTFDLIFDTAPLLMKSGKYEETSFALTMLSTLSKEFSPSIFHRIEQWFPIGIHNWAHADILGMFLLPQFLKKKLVTENDFIPWITSPYKFQRRCVPVTFIKSLKNDPHNEPLLNELLTITEPLMMDAEREVHQGTGWFLREAWKLQPDKIEEFLLKWKDFAPRLVFQYACEKMKPEDRLRFRRCKSK